MIEHINIIDTLHCQIEALLDLMQCSDSSCVDINSTQVASEMCQTMLDEIMVEVDKLWSEFMQVKQTLEEVKTEMCDEYCKYPYIAETQEELLNQCAKCPLNKFEV